ncbi:Qat anti-phage system QueC-like protein QatC [uncultured Pontibacter sp.]|uniref:Qat anti-phage system QueC-like protein QatC n=1 Tax=uncultured Pontibacter sp. TaxID=453356 RepID=UPI002605532A|nr:Qat anti-phage system QueC-like protein QatC [uncultured Pontibacter sp.]
MKIDISLISASALDADDVLRAKVIFTDRRSTPIAQQHADVVINCKGIMDLCTNAPKSAFDFFFIAACAYGIDRFIERRPYSIDGWSREMKVSFPVLDPGSWQGKEKSLADILSFLTGDYWEVQFTASPLILPAASNYPFSHPNIDQVNLFSGGLDSLIGAIDFLTEAPKKNLLLISHYDKNMPGPKGDQKKLFDKLSQKFKQPILWSESVGVYLENATLATRENTLRSRSLLFISLAVMAANAYGTNLPVWVPENGSVSLNYPLSSSRRMACSTRTTHPRLLRDIRKLLSNLNLSDNVKNPYELLTKGEMVNRCADKSFLMSIVGESNSCGKRGHRRGWRAQASHCGVCMPCVYRRAALAGSSDPTNYGFNIEDLRRDSTNTRLINKRGQDLNACLDFLGTPLNIETIKVELLINGLNDLNSLSQYAIVVNNTRDELKDWIRRSPDSMIRNKAGLS